MKHSDEFERVADRDAAVERSNRMQNAHRFIGWSGWFILCSASVVVGAVVIDALKP